MRLRRRSHTGIILPVLLGAFLALAGGVGTAAAAEQASSAPLPAGQALTGVFSITPGRCQALGAPSGSYLQLAENGVPVPNTSSPCVTYTLLSQGSQGLVSGAYQLDPAPTFDGNGNSLANGIFAPVTFLGTRFGGATTCADQQHAPTLSGACPAGRTGFPVPQLSAEPIGTGGCTANLVGALGNAAALTSECLYGNLLGFGVTWNGSGTCATGSPGAAGCYDQGVATDASLATTKCVGAPAADCSLTGSYDPTSGAYSLTVTARVVGTSFNGAVGTYHLAGTFTPGKVASSTSSAGGGSGQGSGSGPRGSGQPSGSGSAQPSGSGSGHPAGRTSGAGATQTVTSLAGVLQISPGGCAGSGPPTGSWIQLSKGGGPIPNPNSPCSGGSYTPVQQGRTGLQLGSFQPNPLPTFDGSGNSLAGSIIAPAQFLGADFGAATDPQNEQTGPGGPSAFPAPSATVNGGSLSADVSAVNFTYNGPPNGTCASGGGTGCYAVGSAQASGSFDPATSSYVLAWTSTIHGGSFNGAAATFHLVGRFVGHEVRQVRAAGSSQGGTAAPAAVSAGLEGAQPLGGTQPAASSAAASGPTVPGSALAATPQVAGSSGGNPTSTDVAAHLASGKVALAATVSEIASLSALSLLLLAAGYLVRRTR